MAIGFVCGGGGQQPEVEVARHYRLHVRLVRAHLLFRARFICSALTGAVLYCTLMSLHDYEACHPEQVAIDYSTPQSTGNNSFNSV